MRGQRLLYNTRCNLYREPGMETAMPGIGNGSCALIWKPGMETTMPDMGIARHTEIPSIGNALIWELGMETAIWGCPDLEAGHGNSNV